MKHIALKLLASLLAFISFSSIAEVQVPPEVLFFNICGNSYTFTYSWRSDDGKDTPTSPIPEQSTVIIKPNPPSSSTPISYSQFCFTTYKDSIVTGAECQQTQAGMQLQISCTPDEKNPKNCNCESTKKKE